MHSVRELQRAVERSYHQFNRDTKGYSECCKLDDTLLEVNAHFGAKVKRKLSVSVPIRYYYTYPILMYSLCLLDTTITYSILMYCLCVLDTTMTYSILMYCLCVLDTTITYSILIYSLCLLDTTITHSILMYSLCLSDTTITYSILIYSLCLSDTTIITLYELEVRLRQS